MYSFNPHLGADLQANAVHYLFCQTSCLLVSNIQGEKMHIIDKSNNAFPIRLLCIAMATKRWNQPRWKHFQGWSLMAQIIAETYTSPKQTTSRINNVLSSLSSATSVHLSTGSPVSKTHATYCRMFQTLQICAAGTAPHCCRFVDLNKGRCISAPLISLKFTLRRRRRRFVSGHFVLHVCLGGIKSPP